MRQIDAAAVGRHLPMATLIAALRTAFVTGCDVPTRTTLTIGAGNGANDPGNDDESADGTAQAAPVSHPPAGHILLMPAWRPGGRFGVKTIAVFPGNAARGQPALNASYLLLDATTGVPLALIDGDVLTTRRTAAASALAAAYLARADARRLLVVGSGRIAAVVVEAMRAVRPLTSVRVWNHRPVGAAALVDRLRAMDDVASLDIAVADNLRAAVRDADIVSCATLSTAPLIRAEWLAPGVHLDLIGSFTPAMRETDAGCFARCRVFVDTDEALAKSGDVLGAIAAGSFAPEHLQATLAELCTGTRPGRGTADECTLFKSVGSALEDLAAAETVFDAVERESLSSAAVPAPLPPTPPRP